MLPYQYCQLQVGFQLALVLPLRPSFSSSSWVPLPLRGAHPPPELPSDFKNYHSLVSHRCSFKFYTSAETPVVKAEAEGLGFCNGTYSDRIRELWNLPLDFDRPSSRIPEQLDTELGVSHLLIFGASECSSPSFSSSSISTSSIALSGFCKGCPNSDALCHNLLRQMNVNFMEGEGTHVSRLNRLSRSC